MALDPGEDEALTTWGRGDSASNAVRRGEVVLKPGGPWAGGVIALLRHLETVGFTGAPHVVGTGTAPDGRMTFAFVPGESPHPGPWSDDQFENVGGLLRSFHEAAATFTPPVGVGWQTTWLHEIHSGDGVVIGHGDPAPWNIVGINGAPDALVDWEFAGPINPITELAYMVWLNAQLHDDDIAALQGLADAPTRARQAASILDGYGIPAAHRPEVIDRMIEVAIHSARAEAVFADITPESTQGIDADGYPVLWAITWRARSASWMSRHRALLISGGR